MDSRMPDHRHGRGFDREGSVKVAKAMIRELEKKSRSHGEEIARLEKELSMTV